MSTLVEVTLSTGRTIIAGIHCYSSGYRLDGTRIVDAPAMTEAEKAEAWAIVDARLAEYRLERGRS